MQKRTRFFDTAARTCAAVAAGVLLPAAATLAVSLLPAAVVQAQTPDLASAKVGTAQVTVTHWGIRPVRTGESYTLEKMRSTQVQIDRAGNRARIEEIAPKDAKPDFRPSLLVSDGKEQHEFIGARNQFLKSEAAATGEGVSSRTGMTGVPLALAFGWKSGDLAKYTPGPDGAPEGGQKPLKVYVREYTVNGKDQTYTYTQKLWVDPATRLPVQHSMFVTDAAGKTQEVQRAEFSEWKLNASLPASLFVWNPPAGATEYKQPERPPLLAVGTTAPDFTVAKWGGGDLKLSDLRGKVVILDFWATWCGPCQMSMPHVEKIHRRAKDSGVVTLGVCVWDQKDAYEKWVPQNQDKYSFLFAFDPAGRGENNIARKLYQVSGIPTTYIIDRDGKVAATFVGFSPDAEEKMAEALVKAGVDLPKQTADAK